MLFVPLFALAAHKEASMADVGDSSREAGGGLLTSFDRLMTGR